jgi:hypothetical protein
VLICGSDGRATRDTCPDVQSERLPRRSRDARSSCNGDKVLPLARPSTSYLASHRMSSDPDSWDTALQQLEGEGTLNAQGLSISADRLERIVDGARRYGEGRPVLREANFREATFEAPANFEGVTFEGETHFDEATFGRRVEFRQATFRGVVHFRRAVFSGKVHFEEATFEREAHFPEATFGRTARFENAVFKGFAHFPDVTFGKNAVFRGADLKGGLRLGPALVAGGLVLDEASLGDVDMRVSTPLLCCLRTRFHDPAHLKVRWAKIQPR